MGPKTIVSTFQKFTLLKATVECFFHLLVLYSYDYLYFTALVLHRIHSLFLFKGHLTDGHSVFDMLYVLSAFCLYCMLLINKVIHSFIHSLLTDGQEFVMDSEIKKHLLAQKDAKIAAVQKEMAHEEARHEHALVKLQSRSVLSVIMFCTFDAVTMFDYL